MLLQLYIRHMCIQTCSLHTGEEGVFFIGDILHWTVVVKLCLQSVNAPIFSFAIMDAFSGLQHLSPCWVRFHTLQTKKTTSLLSQGCLRNTWKLSHRWKLLQSDWFHMLTRTQSKSVINITRHIQVICHQPVLNLSTYDELCNLDLQRHYTARLQSEMDRLLQIFPRRVQLIMCTNVWIHIHLCVHRHVCYYLLLWWKSLQSQSWSGTAGHCFCWGSGWPGCNSDEHWGSVGHPDQMQTRG